MYRLKMITAISQDSTENSAAADFMQKRTRFSGSDIRGEAADKDRIDLIRKVNDYVKNCSFKVFFE